MTTAPSSPNVKVEPAILERLEPVPDVPILEAAVQRIRPLIEALPEAEVRSPTVDSQLAYTNAMTGHHLLKPHFSLIQSLPNTDARLIAAIPDLAMALVWASSQLRVATQEASDHPEKLARMRQLRKSMLHLAQSAAALGLVPEEPVELIAKGSGILDAARDTVDLAAFIRQYPPVFGGGFITAALLVEADALAVGVMNVNRPSNAPSTDRPLPMSLQELVDARNRIWVLLNRAQQEAVRVANFLRIESFPSIGSRQGYKRMPAKAEQAQPTQPETQATVASES